MDPEYCVSESHRSLLVHGPFSAVLLLTVLNSRLAPGEAVRVFDYRNFRPLYVNEELTVCVRKVDQGTWEVWIQGVDGGIAVKGTVTTSLKEGAKL